MGCLCEITYFVSDTPKQTNNCAEECPDFGLFSKKEAVPMEPPLYEFVVKVRLELDHFRHTFWVLLDVVTSEVATYASLEFVSVSFDEFFLAIEEGKVIDELADLRYSEIVVSHV